jgi:Uma2 family endonuclease
MWLHGERSEAKMSSMSSSPIRHVRPAHPLRFPASHPEWEMPEGLRHNRLCEALYQILTRHLGPSHSVGADQFVYFDASHPKRCLAPDAFVKLGVPQTLFDSWKTWELGTPNVCVEILSPSDTKEKLTLRQKLTRYAALGTPEVVVFDVDAPAGSRLRVWDHRSGDLVERIVEHETSPCLALGLDWVVGPTHEVPATLTLRLAKGGVLLLTGEEAARAEREAERRAKEAERSAKEAERSAKEAERSAKEAERSAKEEALREVARLRELLARK